MTKRSIDASDTMESAIHLLYKMQSEGWILSRLEERLEYASPTKKGHRLPIGATVTIWLEPTKG